MTTRTRQSGAVTTVAVETGFHPPNTWYTRWGKRCFDVIGSVLLLLGTLWMFPILALLVKFTSPGTIMFNQARVGLNGKPFVMFKFRTLVWKKAGSRQKIRYHRTIAGRVMRRFRLDELPQLFNVLRGEMSLIGPRPQLPEEHAQLDPLYAQRITILGGISGLAQVRIGRPVDELTERQKYSADLEYIQNLSLCPPILIVLRNPPGKVPGTVSLLRVWERSLPVTKSLLIFSARNWFCARGDLSLLFRAYSLQLSLWSRAAFRSSLLAFVTRVHV